MLRRVFSFSRSLKFASPHLLCPPHLLRSPVKFYGKAFSSRSETLSIATYGWFEGLFYDHERVQELLEPIREVCLRIEEASMQMEGDLALVHMSPISDVLKKVKAQIDLLKCLHCKFVRLLPFCHGISYMFYDMWSPNIQKMVTLLVFYHYLEIGCELSCEGVEEKLGLKSSGLGIAVEDYPAGVCRISIELPRYVEMQSLAGNFASLLHMLNFVKALYSKLSCQTWKDSRIHLKRMSDDITKITETMAKAKNFKTLRKKFEEAS